jgi:hypothetical protein
VEFGAWTALHDLGDEDFRAVMLDVRLFQEIHLHIAFAGWIEDLFFDLSMHRDLEANLLGECLLTPLAARFFKFSE